MDPIWTELIKQLIPLIVTGVSGILWIRQQMGRTDARIEEVMRRLQNCEQQMNDLSGKEKREEVMLLRIEDLMKKMTEHERVLQSYMSREMQIVEGIQTMRVIDTRLTTIEVKMDHISKSIGH